MRLRRSLIALLLILAIGRPTDVRADLYWDSNGTSAGGSNSDAAPGAWGVDSFWGADPSGLAVTGPWVADETAVFSADANVIGIYDVTVSATQSASGIRFEEGTVTLNGGTINLANAATVNVAAGLTSTIISVLTGSAGLTQSGSGTLVLTSTVFVVMRTSGVRVEMLARSNRCRRAVSAGSWCRSTSMRGRARSEPSRRP